jgi:ATP-binding protein involved in chromosome partitioning
LSFVDRRLFSVPPSPDQIRAALAGVKFPGLSRDIVSFGLVENVEVEDRLVRIRLSVPSGDNRAIEQMARDAHGAVSQLEGVDEVQLDISAPRAATPGAPLGDAAPPGGGMNLPGAPPANAGTRPAAGPASRVGPPEPLIQRDPIPGVKHVLAVASGKGGVGKSTVASNLAVAFQERGLSVGLMDADIYGPSVPTMFGIHEQPEIIDVEGRRMIIPLQRHGLKLMSLGFLQPEDAPVIWRGPLVMKAVRQFLRDVDWRECDILVIDLPPGTGDAQLTLTQSAPLDGAVIVTTPQDVSLIDARKGLNMFREVDVPVIGIVENMSVFRCPECGHKEHIFRQGGGRRTAEELGVPLLGDIPIDPRIAEAGDAGTPTVLAHPDSDAARAFGEIAGVVAAALMDT